MIVENPRAINVSALDWALYQQEREKIKAFDCGVSMLNQFIRDKRKCIEHLTQRIAKTYLVYDDETLVGYYCLSAGTLRATEIIRSRYKSWKVYSTYPATIIGRFAIHNSVADRGYGSSTMDYIKRQIAMADLPMSVRYLAVDALNETNTTNFYLKNNFDFLLKEDRSDTTRIMYFDINQLFS